MRGEETTPASLEDAAARQLTSLRVVSAEKAVMANFASGLILKIGLFINN
jgi:hypothetical protein